MEKQIGRPGADVNWLQIRLEYETTQATLRDIAERHGLKSHNTILRKIKAQCWERSAKPVVVKVTKAATETTAKMLAGHVVTPPPVETRADNIVVTPPTVETRADNIVADPMDPPMEPPQVAPEQHNGAAEAEKVAPERHNGAAEAEKIAPEPPAQEIMKADEIPLLTMRELAGFRADRMRAQLMVAAKIQGTGLAILDRLCLVLNSQDSAEIALNIRRLIAINPERESMASLVKAAGELIDRGVIAERRALGMDIMMQPGPDRESRFGDTKSTSGGVYAAHPVVATADVATAEPGQGIAKATELIRRLDVDMAMQLREVAERTRQAQRDAITSQSQEAA